MGDSREGSPDWLRSFQAPSRSLLTLSSGSDSSLNNSPIRDDGADVEEEPIGRLSQRGADEGGAILIDSGDESLVDEDKKSKTPKKTGKQTKKHDLKEETRNAKEGEVAEEAVSEKPSALHVSSRLPLMIPEKVQRLKALVECDDDSIDLSGDVGAVGRIAISNTPTGNQMLLDLKGTIYQSTIVPSRTFCIVSFGQTEAKVEAIMNDFVQLKPHSNVFEAETMIEGTLDGFSFDMEDEGDRIPKSSDQNKKDGEQADARTNGKVEKSSGVMRKKAKIAAKPPKKGARKPQVSKKVTTSRK